MLDKAYDDRQQVYNNYNHEADADPNGAVDILASVPMDISVTAKACIVITESHCICERHNLARREHSVCKPDRSAVAQTVVSWGKMYQYTQPTANPTPRSRNRRGNSIIGALTGIRAVISPRQEMMEAMIVPTMR